MVFSVERSSVSALILRCCGSVRRELEGNCQNCTEFFTATGAKDAKDAEPERRNSKSISLIQILIGSFCKNWLVPFCVFILPFASFAPVAVKNAISPVFLASSSAANDLCMGMEHSS